MGCTSLQIPKWTCADWTPWLLHAMPLMAHATSLRLVALCIGCFDVRLEERRRVLRFTAESIRYVQKLTGSIAAHIERLSARHAHELCSLAYCGWAERVSRVKERRRRSAQSAQRRLRHFFCAWRIYTTKQLDLSSFASAITGQVISGCLSGHLSSSARRRALHCSPAQYLTVLLGLQHASQCCYGSPPMKNRALFLFLLKTLNCSGSKKSRSNVF